MEDSQLQYASPLHWGLVSKYRSQLFGFAILWIMCMHSREFTPLLDDAILSQYILYDGIILVGGVGVDIFLFLSGVGLYYAQAINDNFGLDFDVVFGPAYKGIPLAVVTAMALQELYGKEVKYCCNRKEVKDHGADAGNLLGAELHDGDKVIMVEDVTTSGKSIDETYPILKAAADVDVRGLIVSLNRMEVGKGGVTTAQKEIEAKYGFPVASIVSMAEVKECLHNHEVAGRIVIDDDIAAAIDAYYEQWGAKE